MSRPKLEKNITLNSFEDYYWLKDELVAFCRMIGINSTGGKNDISNRIVKFIDTGEIITKSKTRKAKPISNFDWKTERLSINTIITDNYKNTENVRTFFENAIGKHFKFNVTFMKWMKTSSGKTLEDAIDTWKQIAELKKDKNYKSEIAPQFEYNTYTRDFHADNPGLSSKEAIICWKIKKGNPGNNKYEKSDLVFLKQKC
jgi:Domain of unknown function (DUF6434)/SAP domain-containing new25